MSAPAQFPIRPGYGFFLSLLTAVLWGVLPLFLTLVLQKMDAITITMYRFGVSAIFVFLLLLRTGGMPSRRLFGGSQWWLMLLAAAGLIGNYVLYLMGVDYLNPESAQVMIQLAPLLLMMGGIFIYGERFRPVEWLGALILIGGLVLFFNEKLGLIFDSVNQYSLGVGLLILAALTWAFYGLLQKRLLQVFSAKQVTWAIYSIGAVTLLPFSNPLEVIELNSLQVFALAFCCANTIVGYGAFTEAMQCWHASKVSAVVSTAPIWTILAMSIAIRGFPEHFSATQINNLAYFGAFMVVSGSILASTGRLKPVRLFRRR